MIHTVYVDAETDLLGLKKEVRKKLMTGGAVIRLRDGLTPAEQRAIFNRYSSEARPNSIAAQVLVQLAHRAETDPAIVAELEGVTLHEVKEALRSRAGQE
jgi:hypothetical protein